MSQAAQPYISFEDFIAEEAVREGKREWLNGVVYDMGGGSYEHGLLAVSVTSALRVALAGACSVGSSDNMIYVRETDLATYADGVVICGAPNLMEVLRKGKVIGAAVTNPRLVVEVLSPSTETYDRTEKFSHYMRIPSLQEYVLVSSSERRIEVHRRPEGRGHWTVEVGGLGDSVSMCGHTFRIDDLYAV